MDDMDKTIDVVKKDINNNRDLFNQYTMLETIYDLLHKDVDNNYPYNWHTSYTYNERIALLTKAINDNKTIIEEIGYTKIK